REVDVRESDSGGEFPRFKTFCTTTSFQQVEYLITINGCKVQWNDYGRVPREELLFVGSDDFFVLGRAQDLEHLQKCEGVELILHSRPKARRTSFLQRGQFHHNRQM
ncbi:glyoxalase family protein, partial [Moniliophthora roreri]